MSTLLDIVMVLFLRAKHWQIASLSALPWLLRLTLPAFASEMAMSLVGILLYLWSYSICRFSAIRSGHFGNFKALSLFCLALFLAYSVAYAFLGPFVRAPYVVMLVAFSSSIWAAKGLVRIMEGEGRAVSFWMALLGFWIFPLGVWYIQPSLNEAAKVR